MTSIEMHSAVQELKENLKGPLYNRIIKKNVGDGSLDYELYVRTSELLDLQLEGCSLSSHDELMFQMVHQAQELWLKLATHEMTAVLDSLDRDDLWQASASLERLVRIVGCLTRELTVLETLTPDAFLVIRRNLGNGSGQESPGYNRFMLAASFLSQAVDRLLERKELNPVRVYADVDAHAAVKRVLEQLLDLDESAQSWLIRHYMLVRRTIGIGRDTAALDGVPTTILPARMTQPLFSQLWKAREELTAAWQRPGGYAPGETRSEAAA
ncbi:tryptophan 2,3-dioxygenase family protein [Streptomyces sp. NPDC002952]|uniref:tryptophan 2,3-dioxygenase family protein n=1 Tax=Streptomyces sp. NPDC002952 TaxID=3364673 RepID=UPI0036BE6276